MTQTNTTNSYTQCTMNSTSVYNYIKRMARNYCAENVAINLDCLAEALIQSYGDDTDIDKSQLKKICVADGFFTPLDFREMECHVVTSMSTVPFSVAHVD